MLATVLPSKEFRFSGTSWFTSSFLKERFSWSLKSVITFWMTARDLTLWKYDALRLSSGCYESIILFPFTSRIIHIYYKTPEFSLDLLFLTTVLAGGHYQVLRLASYPAVGDFSHLPVYSTLFIPQFLRALLFQGQLFKKIVCDSF